MRALLPIPSALPDPRCKDTGRSEQRFVLAVDTCECCPFLLAAARTADVSPAAARERVSV